MKIKDKLHNNLSNEKEVNKILRDFAFHWWLFGIGCGIVFYWFVNLFA